MWRVYIRQCLMYLTYHFLLRLSCNGITFLLYIENPRIVRGFSKSFSVASSKSYSFRVRLDCGPSTAIKTLKEAI